MLLAHKLAFSSKLIRADMIESMEFPHLVNRYRVNAVPLIVINEVLRIEGAYPEPLFMEQLMKVTDKAAMEELTRNLGSAAGEEADAGPGK